MSKGIAGTRKKAVGYCRVSTEKQAEEGHSLAAQARAIEELAGRKDWQLVTIYREAGQSGSLTERPELDKLLAGAQAGEFEIVVVHSIDRFYRNLQGLLMALQTLQELGVAFVSVQENLDFTTPWGKLTLAVLGTLAEIYLDKLKQETKKGLRERARQGIWNGTIPLGYCRGVCSRCEDPNGPGYCPLVGGPDIGDGQRLVAHPIESEAVKRAFAWSAAGLSDRAVAKNLNDATLTLKGKTYGFRTKRHFNRGGPKEFSKDSVRDILTRIFYTGVVPYYGTTENGRKRKRHEAIALYPGQHPALIEQDAFERLQTERRTISKNPRTRLGKRTKIYPLSGILYCAECGGKMRVQGASGGRSYYVCSTRLQKKGQCKAPAVKTQVAEAELLAVLNDVKLPEKWREILELGAGLDPAQVAVEKMNAAARFERAKELYLSGTMNGDEFAAEQRRWEVTLKDLTPDAMESIMVVESHLISIQQRWRTLKSIEQKKALQQIVVKAFIRRSVLSAVKLSGQIYDLFDKVGTISLPVENCLYSGSDGHALSGKLNLLNCMAQTAKAVFSF